MGGDNEEKQGRKEQRSCERCRPGAAAGGWGWGGRFDATRIPLIAPGPRLSAVVIVASPHSGPSSPPVPGVGGRVEGGGVHKLSPISFSAFHD